MSADSLKENRHVNLQQIMMIRGDLSKTAIILFDSKIQFTSFSLNRGQNNNNKNPLVGRPRARDSQNEDARRTTVLLLAPGACVRDGLTVHTSEMREKTRDVVIL